MSPVPSIADTDCFIAAERARTAEFCAECDRLILGCRSMLSQADELLREIRAQLGPKTAGERLEECLQEGIMEEKARTLTGKREHFPEMWPPCFDVCCLSRCDTPAPQTWKERQ